MLSLFTKRISGVVYFSLSSSISLFILALISIFITWLIRGWLVVSGVDYAFPTNFVFQPCSQAGVCSFPSASIDLRRPYSPYDSILTPDLQYTAALRFRVSDSESSRLAGMFMVKFALETGHGRTISACTTSTSIPYRSSLIRTLRRLFFWPLMIFDYLQEYHTIHVRCPDPISFSSASRSDDLSTALTLRVEIQNIAIQMVNDGRVELAGHLRGLQYYLYWWPILSTLCLFLTIFWCSTSVSCGLWLIRSAKNSSTPSANSQNRTTERSPPSPLTPSPLPSLDNFDEYPKTKKSFSDEIPSDLEFRKSSRDAHGYSPMLTRMYGELEDDDDIQCFQRRLANRMQNALDLDDSNLGS